MTKQKLRTGQAFWRVFRNARRRSLWRGILLASICALLIHLWRSSDTARSLIVLLVPATLFVYLYLRQSPEDRKRYIDDGLREKYKSEYD